MAIFEQPVVEIANVEINDEYRIELKQFRKRVDYTPDQADQLATELIDKAATVREMLARQNAELRERLRSVSASEVL